MLLISQNIELNRDGGSSSVLSSAAVRWGDRAAAGPLGTFDVVLCADVLFSDEAVPPLVRSIADLTRPGSCVLSCCEHRWPGATKFYELLAAAGFSVDRVPASDQPPAFRHPSLHLFRATRLQGPRGT